MDGDFYITRTTIRDEAWLRLVIQNPCTEASDIAALVDRLEAMGAREEEVACNPAVSCRSKTDPII